MGPRADWGKNHNHTFILTVFNFFGRFNIFPTYAGVNIRVSSYQPIEIVMRSYDLIDRQVAYGNLMPCDSNQ